MDIWEGKGKAAWLMASNGMAAFGRSEFTSIVLFFFFFFYFFILFWDYYYYYMIYILRS